MAKSDHDVKIRVSHTDWSYVAFWLALAAVLIAGMHYGYECGCP